MSLHNLEYILGHIVIEERHAFIKMQRTWQQVFFVFLVKMQPSWMHLCFLPLLLYVNGPDFVLWCHNFSPLGLNLCEVYYTQAFYLAENIYTRNPIMF